MQIEKIIFSSLLIVSLSSSLVFPFQEISGQFEELPELPDLPDLPDLPELPGEGEDKTGYILSGSLMIFLSIFSIWQAKEHIEYGERVKAFLYILGIIFFSFLAILIWAYVFS